jgi:hypothetical protein
MKKPRRMGIRRGSAWLIENFARGLGGPSWQQVKQTVINREPHHGYFTPVREVYNRNREMQV